MITSGFKFLSLAEIRNNSEELTNFSKIVFDSVLKKELETNDEVSLTDINDDWYNDLASFYDCESANWFNQIGNIYSTRSVLDSFLDAQAEVIISDLEREVLQLHKTPAALVNEMLDQLPKRFGRI
ncbi:MAG: hypothetical protein HC836_23415 [Richelia sp. RM2_1_2]|nr:hypothetical protein [Richelia sp. RM2_1_2]